jgi:hypothetical protein
VSVHNLGKQAEHLLPPATVADSIVPALEHAAYSPCQKEQGLIIFFITTGPENASVGSVKISPVQKIVLQGHCQNLQLCKVLVNK